MTRQQLPISLTNAQLFSFSPQNHRLMLVDGLLDRPESAVEMALLQNFAEITPQYPGVRAALDPAICADWVAKLSPMLSQQFDEKEGPWSMRAWFSLVTRNPTELLPIQRLPHVDGTDPRQVAMMLYLHRTGHGGTAFFRHRSTGLEAITADDFPRYKQALERDVARGGLPRAAYVTDGTPFFERIHATSGGYNQAAFYRGNILHSGVIDNRCALSSDPAIGRLTINAFFQPPQP